MDKVQKIKSADRMSLVFHKTSEMTCGQRLEMIVSNPPNSSNPALHYHPKQEDHFEVLQGEFQVTIGEVEHTYHVGKEYIIPKNTRGSMLNSASTEGRLMWQVIR